MLAIQEQACGREHYRLAATLNNLAIIYDQALDYPAALAIHERVLAIRRRVLAPDHPDIAETLNNLGNALRNTGEPERALAAFEEAIVIRRNKYGHHAKTALVLTNAGRSWMEAGDMERARQALEEAVAIYEGTLGNDFDGLALPLHVLGILEQQAGNLASARRHVERAVRLRESGLGHTHYLLIAPLQTLLEIAETEGDLDRAAQVQHRVATLADVQNAMQRVSLAAPPDLSRVPQQLAGVSVDVVLDQIKAHYARDSEYAKEYVIENIHQYWVDSRPDDAIRVHIEYTFRRLQHGLVGCDARVFDLRRAANGWSVEKMGARLSARFHTWRCDASSLSGDATG